LQELSVAFSQVHRRLIELTDGCSELGRAIGQTAAINQRIRSQMLGRAAGLAKAEASFNSKMAEHEAAVEKVLALEHKLQTEREAATATRLGLEQKLATALQQRDALHDKLKEAIAALSVRQPSSSGSSSSVVLSPELASRLQADTLVPAADVDDDSKDGSDEEVAATASAAAAVVDDSPADDADDHAEAPSSPVAEASPAPDSD
jgi:hypothetical protein